MNIFARQKNFFNKKKTHFHASFFIDFLLIVYFRQ